MNVWGNVKKLSLGGFIAGGLIIMSSFSVTGCLTDDKDDDTTSTPVDNSIKLTNEKTNDTIWNIQGKNRGSFDLVTGTLVSQSTSDASKDAVDMSTVGTTGVDFPKTWKSLNGGMFVTAASGFDYANATDSSVIKAYAAGGTPSATTKVLAPNDIIIEKLRGGSRYAVIKITDVVVTTAATDNLDYILFNYKLTP
jgi:hypothetical protein